jgi:hypothetical protein
VGRIITYLPKFASNSQVPDSAKNTMLGNQNTVQLVGKTKRLRFHHITNLPHNTVAMISKKPTIERAGIDSVMVAPNLMNI